MMDKSILRQWLKAGYIQIYLEWAKDRPPNKTYRGSEPNTLQGSV